MKIEIITTEFNLLIYGFSEFVKNQNYAETAFKLSDKVWKTVKQHNLKNQGLNIWVYDTNGQVFAGVELDETPNQALELDRKQISLKKYAYHKHIGSYRLIADTGKAMNNELIKLGEEVILPYIEIYGHWNNDESKLETDLLMALK